MHWLKAFWLAFQSLTRVPVATPQSATDEDHGKSLVFYPLVGLVIGLVLIVMRFPLFSASATLQAVLLLAAWVLLTGATHLGSLAYSADTWLGGNGGPGRAADTLKGNHSGTGAVVLIVLVLLLKYAALSQLLASTPGWTALIAAPVLARAVVVGLFLTTNYTGRSDNTATMVSHIPRKASWLSIFIALALSILFLGLWAPLVLVFAGVMAFAMRMLMQRRVDGTTDDTAGAMIEVIEAAVLTGAALSVDF